MKKIYLSLFIIISTITISNAQKHELQIGMPGAFYFDENLPKISIPLPSHLSYFYKLNNDYNIQFRYDYYSIGTDSKEPYKTGQTLSRRFNEYSLGVGKKWLDLTPKIEITYHSNLLYRSGQEYYHAYYYIHWGTEPLSKLRNRTYNNLGLDLGGQIHYKLTKHLGVGFTASYARHFSRLSPNELRFAIFGSVRI